jgi:hypothetical protein
MTRAFTSLAPKSHKNLGIVLDQPGIQEELFLETLEVQGPSTHLNQSTLGYLVNHHPPDENPWWQDLS